MGRALVQLDGGQMKGKNSPWGVIDWARELAPGVWTVTTPGHGGIWLSPERVAGMPEAVRAVATFVERSVGRVSGSASGRWYEEDCDAALVALAFPELFPREFIPVAVKIASGYHVTIAAWFDSLPANHALRCSPGAPAVVNPPASSQFQLTGSDRPADVPGQGELL
jgi:hypothetical protein